MCYTVCPRCGSQCVHTLEHSVLHCVPTLWKYCFKGINTVKMGQIHTVVTLRTLRSHHVATMCITMLPHCVSPCCHTVYHHVDCIVQPHYENAPHCKTVGPVCATRWNTLCVTVCTTLFFHSVIALPHCGTSPTLWLALWTLHCTTVWSPVIRTSNYHTPAPRVATCSLVNYS